MMDMAEIKTATASRVARTEGGFVRAIGLFDGTMIVVGSMIGSGIFIVAADISRQTGSAGGLLFAWIITGLLTVSAALSYGELAALFPHAGGQYIYLREAYSPLWGFLYGWTSFLVIQTGTIAAVGVAVAKFLGVFFPALGTGEDAVLFEVKDLNIRIALDIPWMAKAMTFFERESFTITGGQLVGAGLVVLLTLLNCLGVREGKWVQNIFTVGKTFALVVLIVLG